jgi:hypothetical protein
MLMCTHILWKQKLQVRKFAERNRKFQAIDKAIGRDGLKFVTLLRLSPLLPLAASNYLYGLTRCAHNTRHSRCYWVQQLTTGLTTE